MLFPYGDNLTHGKTFFAVTFLIAIMSIISLYGFLNPDFNEWSINYLGFVPLYFSISPWSHIHTLVTSQFLHADSFHLIGNCLFLWVFGRSLERLFGPWRFLVLSPFLGVVGLLAHWAIFPNSNAPVIGSSGAIATLMGTYLALFPSARMKMFIFLGIFFKRFQVPAWIFLFYWGFLQLLSLLFGSGGMNNIAYAVHIGGFVLGILSGIVWKVSYPFAEERLLAFIKSAESQ